MSEENKLPRIDVIIPAYNCHNTIIRTICSILEQQISQELDVTIVDDCSTDGDYQYVVDMFKPYLSIKQIKMPENGGPGNARQFGIDNTTNPLITFIDADDTFSGCFALKELRRQMLIPQAEGTYNIACFSNFVEENQDNIYLPHPNDVVWMFGKLYFRPFLDKFKIRFNPEGSRANEDNGFNLMVRLCANNRELIKFIPDITYYWLKRDDSITRSDNCNYSYNASFVGYADNMIYAIKHADEMGIGFYNSAVNQIRLQTFCNLYQYYLEVVERDPRYEEQDFNACYKFYKEVYRDVKDKITPEIFGAMYTAVMKNSYMGNKLQKVPSIGIKEFLDKLEGMYQEEMRNKN